MFSTMLLSCFTSFRPEIATIQDELPPMREDTPTDACPSWGDIYSKMYDYYEDLTPAQKRRWDRENPNYFW